MMTTDKKKHEIEHGKIISQLDTEKVWGWGTPAGKLRFERRANLIVDHAHLGPEFNILEIGCGTGNFTEVFAKTGSRIVAVDISPELLTKARERSLPDSRVTFLEKPFEECDVDGPFDAIIGSSVLHHLEIDKSLLKIRDLLKPGGFVAFAEPNMLNPQVFLERKLSFYKPLFWYISPDETAFVRFSLSRKMESIGFVDVNIKPFDWLHPYTPGPLIGFIKQMGRLFERTPLVREFSGSLIISARKPI